MPNAEDAPKFEAIYEQYASQVLNLAYRLTGEEEASRDLTQEIFVKVYQGLAQFEGRSQIYTWIYRIAVNHVTNYIKRARRQRWIGLLEVDAWELLRGRGEETPVQGSLETTERARIVWQAVRSLPVKYRVPLVLYHYEDLSYKEIARTMGLSVAAVETRIHRARKQLISVLGPWIEKI